LAEKIIGILGGLGPEATVDLFHRIIRATPAEKDQDHLRIIIYNNPKIPDRTAAILGYGENPLPELIRTAKVLERAGADFIIIPCNTAHYFYDELRKHVNIPILHMIDLCAEWVRRNFPNIRRAGLLATIGTVKSGIYHKSFKGIGVEIITPEENSQNHVMKAIYEHVKAGDLEGGRKILLRIAGELMDMNCDVIICGCTEVSLVIKNGDLPVPVIDPLQILAENAVKKALNEM